MELKLKSDRVAWFLGFLGGTFIYYVLISAIVYLLTWFSDRHGIPMLRLTIAAGLSWWKKPITIVLTKDSDGSES